MYNKEEFDKTWEKLINTLTTIFGNEVTEDKKWIDASFYINEQVNVNPENLEMLYDSLIPFEYLHNDILSNQFDNISLKKRFQVRVRDAKELARKTVIEDQGENLLANERYKKYCADRDEYVSRNLALKIDYLLPNTEIRMIAS